MTAPLTMVKRDPPTDKWSIRERLCLASAVSKSGDQNWMSVSRVLKPFADPNRPLDWFHQKNCATQYNSLLETVDSPKRKKRESGIESPIEVILRKLTQERLKEIERTLTEEKAEYLKMQEDIALIKSGNATSEMVNKWCREIDEENKRQEEEAAAHSHWLRERELRKQESEKAVRPIGKPACLKRKSSNTLEPEEETNKPALSPLLTSLLKSPSQNVSPSATILNTSIGGAITKEPTKPPQIICIPPNTTNPTIASILNSPHALQQLAAQDVIAIANDILEDGVDSLPNLKVDDLESSLLSDGPLPVMKNEDVEVIISNVESNIEDDLKLDDVNVDIITLQNEFEKYYKGKEEKPEKVDPFEFREDPAICDVPKPSTFNTVKSDKIPDKNETMEDKGSGSVEIVEVVVMDEPEMDELNKTQIQDIVHSILDVPKSSEPEKQPLSQASTVNSTDENSNDKPEETYEELIKVNKQIDSSKRDYSRKRKEETKTGKLEERSHSPWTEEDETKKPATPNDSVPNSPASSGTCFEDDRDYRNWKKSVLLVFSRLTTQKYASLFLKPIVEDQAPGYHGLIYRPIDLQTIRKHIENGTIRNTAELRRDVLLMFTNAIMYNKTNKLVYSMTQLMQKESMQHLDILLHAQDDAPQRRETRTSEPGNKRKRPAEENTRNKKRKED